MTPAEKFRAKLESMTQAERDAALDRLLTVLAPTEDEIAAEVEAMTDEEIDAEMRAQGIDVEKWTAEMIEKIRARMGGAP